MLTRGVSFLAASANGMRCENSTQGTPLLLPRHHPQLSVIAHDCATGHIGVTWGPGVMVSWRPMRRRLFHSSFGPVAGGVSRLGGAVRAELRDSRHVHRS